jgi:alkyl sulfatase BDS1-like metallo-beta-lactamase superfamily hydrolase
LTPRGQAVEPILHELGRWGSREPVTSRNELSADALLVALKTMFSPRVARDLDATYQLVLDGDAYRMRIADGTIDISRGRSSDVVATLDTDRATLRGLVFGGESLDAALARGAATTTGTKRALVRMLGLFPK